MTDCNVHEYGPEEKTYWRNAVARRVSSEFSFVRLWWEMYAIDRDAAAPAMAKFGLVDDRSVVKYRIHSLKSVQLPFSRLPAITYVEMGDLELRHAPGGCLYMLTQAFDTPLELDGVTVGFYPGSYALSRRRPMILVVPTKYLDNPPGDTSRRVLKCTPRELWYLCRLLQRNPESDEQVSVLAKLSKLGIS